MAWKKKSMHWGAEPRVWKAQRWKKEICRLLSFMVIEASPYTHTSCWIDCLHCVNWGRSGLTSEEVGMALPCIIHTAVVFTWCVNMQWNRTVLKSSACVFVGVDFGVCTALCVCVCVCAIPFLLLFLLLTLINLSPVLRNILKNQCVLCHRDPLQLSSTCSIAPQRTHYALVNDMQLNLHFDGFVEWQVTRCLSGTRTLNPDKPKWPVLCASTMICHHSLCSWLLFVMEIHCWDSIGRFTKHGESNWKMMIGLVALVTNWNGVEKEP